MTVGCQVLRVSHFWLRSVFKVFYVTYIHSQVDNWYFNSWTKRDIIYVSSFTFISGVFIKSIKREPACSNHAHVSRFVLFGFSLCKKTIFNFKCIFPWIDATNLEFLTLWDDFEHVKVTFFCRSLCRGVCVCRVYIYGYIYTYRYIDIYS